jgi:hypothetical protein
LAAIFRAELAALRAVYEDNLELIGQGAPYVLSARSMALVYRANIGRLAILLEAETVAAIAEAFALNERIEAFVAACTKPNGGAAYRTDVVTPLKQLRNQYVRGCERTAAAITALDGTNVCWPAKSEQVPTDSDIASAAGLAAGTVPVGRIALPEKPASLLVPIAQRDRNSNEHTPLKEGRSHSNGVNPKLGSRNLAVAEGVHYARQNIFPITWNLRHGHWCRQFSPENTVVRNLKIDGARLQCVVDGNERVQERIETDIGVPRSTWNPSRKTTQPGLSKSAIRASRLA